MNLQISDFIQMLCKPNAVGKMIEFGLDSNGNVIWHRSTDIDEVSIVLDNHCGTYVFDFNFDGTSFDRLISSDYISKITLQNVNEHLDMIFITEKRHKYYTLCLLVFK